MNDGVMVCTGCKQVNHGGAQQCKQCGKQVALACPGCGHLVPAGSKFCSQCATSLTPKESATVSEAVKPPNLAEITLMPTSLTSKLRGLRMKAAGERREVTAMHIRFSGLSGAAPQTAEANYLIYSEVVAQLSKIVYAYEGHIETVNEEQLVAVFGAPITHENDPERALRAALEISESARILRQTILEQHQRAFTLHMGIATGSIILATRGKPPDVQYHVAGQTLRSAADLANMAAGGEICVAPDTYARTKALIQFSPAADNASAKSVYVATSLKRVAGPIRGIFGYKTEMVGRAQPLAQLVAQLAEVRRSNRPAISVLSGDAGLGKSRLLLEFRQKIDADQPEIQFRNAYCEAHAQKRPYGAAATLLRNIMQIAVSDPPLVQLEAVKRHIATLPLDAEAVEPFVLHLLGLAEVAPQFGVQLNRYDADMLQNLTFAAVRQLLLAENALAPTIICVEDLHWIDAISWDLLRYLVRTIDARPVFFVFAARRATAQLAELALLSSKQQISHRLIELDTLSELHSQILIDQFIEVNDPEAEQVKALISQRSAGNPFFIEELVRMLLAEGGLQSKGSSLEVTPAASKLLAAVPPTLIGLILARVDLLAKGVRELLKTISILRHNFSQDLIAALAGLPADVTAQQVQTLLDREFLVDQGDGSFTFAHHLVRDAIYDTLLKRDRQALHLRAGQLIEQHAEITTADVVELLLGHYLASCEPRRAIPYLLESARNAARRYAHETAAEQYRQLLELEGQKDAPDRPLLLAAGVGLGQALKYLGRYDEARQQLNTALVGHLDQDQRELLPDLRERLISGLRELADVEQREGRFQEAIDRLETGLKLAETADEGRRPELRRYLIERLVFVQFRMGLLEQANTLALATTAIIHPEEVSDPAVVASLFGHLGGIAWQQGRLEAAVSHVGKSLQLYQTLNYSRGIANALSNLGILDAQRARWLSAVEYWEQARTLRETIGDHQMLVISLANLSHMRLSLGQFDQAQAAATQGLGIARRIGDRFMLARLLTIQAQINLLEGDHITALENAQKAFAEAEEVNSVEIEVESGWVLATMLGANDQVDTALHTINQILVRAREAGLMEGEAECQRVRGILLTQSGQLSAAERSLREANEYFRQMGHPYSEGRTLMALGNLYGKLIQAGQENHAIQARSSLEDAIFRFETVGAAHDLNQARAALVWLNDLTDDSPVDTLQSESAATLATSSGRHFDPTILWLAVELRDTDDEEMRFVALMELLPACATIAQEYGGQVSFRGDGLMIVFGAPVAGEADAEQAVLAAHHIQTFLREDELAGILAAVRLGLSQGPVVAGQIEGADLAVIGAPVAEAEQIAGQAEPEQIWVTSAVRDAAQRLFHFEALPIAPGFAQPLWRLSEQRSDPAPARGLPGVQTPLIGREAPLTAMQELLEQLLAGEGSIIWLEGEAGIGKSRIMREYRQLVEGKNCLVWFGGCTAQRAKSPFGLFTDLFGRLIGQHHTDSPEEIRQKIARTVQNWPRDAQSTEPYLALLAGIEPDGPEGDRLLALEPEQLRRQIFVAIRRLLKVVAHKQPLLLMLDDLHWIDPMSAELLLFVATIVSSDPLMIVCAQRREGSDAPNERLLRLQGLLSQQTLSLLLNRLTPADSRHLIRELLSAEDLPNEISERIIQLSEGNPYFIEEFVQLLIEQGHLQQTETGWHLKATASDGTGLLPSSLESLIRSRFDSLPDDLRLVLQYCAVIGREFKADFLARVLDRPDALALLERLAARLIFRYDPITERWQFNHVLFQTVVYQSLLASTRRQLHLKIGTAIESYWADTVIDYAEEVAHHYVQAEATEKALPYLIAAGERAATQDANEEALVHFQAASAILAKQTDVDPEYQWRIAVGLGDVYRFVGNYIESTAVLKSGLPLAQSGRLFNLNRAGLYRRLGETSQKKGDYEAAIDYFKRSQTLLAGELNSEQQLEAARNLIGLAWVCFAQGRYGEAHEACQESLAYAGPANGLAELATIENLLGGIYFQQTEWRLALQHTTRAMVLREQMGYSWGVAATLGNLGILNFIVGHWDKAHQFFTRSLAMRQEMGDVEGIAITHNNLAIVYREQGKFELAQQEFENSLAVSQTFAMAFHIANSAAGLAQVHLLAGDLTAAKAILAMGLEQAKEIGAKESLTELYRVRANICLAEEDLIGATQWGQEASCLAIEIGNRSHEAACWCISSEIARREGDLESALVHIDHARSLLEETTDELESGRLALQAGRILAEMYLPVESLAEFQLAKQIFTRLGASYYLDLLDTLMIQT